MRMRKARTLGASSSSCSSTPAGSWRVGEDRRRRIKQGKIVHGRKLEKEKKTKRRRMRRTTQTKNSHNSVLNFKKFTN